MFSVFLYDAFMSTKTGIKIRAVGKEELEKVCKTFNIFQAVIAAPYGRSPKRVWAMIKSAGTDRVTLTFGRWKRKYRLKGVTVRTIYEWEEDSPFRQGFNDIQVDISKILNWDTIINPNIPALEKVVILALDDRGRPLELEHTIYPSSQMYEKVKMLEARLRQQMVALQLCTSKNNELTSIVAEKDLLINSLRSMVWKYRRDYEKIQREFINTNHELAQLTIMNETLANQVNTFVNMIYNLNTQYSELASSLQEALRKQRQINIEMVNDEIERFKNTLEMVLSQTRALASAVRNISLQEEKWKQLQEYQSQLFSQLQQGISNLEKKISSIQPVPTAPPPAPVEEKSPSLLEKAKEKARGAARVFLEEEGGEETGEESETGAEET